MPTLRSILLAATLAVLAGCAARYQAVTQGEDLFLLDTRSGELWLAEIKVKSQDQNGRKSLTEGFPKVTWQLLSHPIAKHSAEEVGQQASPGILTWRTLRQSGCLACHQVDLSSSPTRSRPPWLQDWIADPQKFLTTDAAEKK